ncbi:PepSY domain-containing protein [[Clostridium] spiroforme]|nr:PepSY domain-containing protein [Thomasclavelia spiroformis]
MKKLFALMLVSVMLFGCSNSSKVEAISLEEAEKIALKEVDGEILKAGKDKDDGITYYDFTIVTDTEKYEVEVNAENGKVLKVEKDDDYVPAQSNTTDQTNQSNTQNTTQITAEKAQEIAMNKVGTGTLVKCELDYDDDTQKYKYEIEIRDGRVEYELDIDAVSGDIIKFEQDHD